MYYAPILSQHTLSNLVHVYSILCDRPECSDICVVITDGATNPGTHTDRFNDEAPLFRASCNR